MIHHAFDPCIFMLMILWDGTKNDPDEYVKDLLQLNRDLRNVIFLDDHPSSFRYQPNYAILVPKYSINLKNNVRDTILDLYSKWLTEIADNPKDMADLILDFKLKHYL
eukprot:NODE_152_length_15391_cov_0.883272.p20 type:complete len:108 gc:universal NODE_152_length_15391_cov_0.883272:4137-4460(+)